MPPRLPAGKRLAVSIGVDFDAEVGTPRLLRLFAKHGIPTTWCTPGHTLITFPDRIREVIDSGHQIAAHGAYYESEPSHGEAEERRRRRPACP